MDDNNQSKSSSDSEANDDDDGEKEAEDSEQNEEEREDVLDEITSDNELDAVEETIQPTNTTELLTTNEYLQIIEEGMNNMMIIFKNIFKSYFMVIL